MKALALVLSAFLATAEVVSSDATRLTQHGDAQLAEGDPAGAAESYRAAIAADPNAFEARVNLGAALVQVGDVEGAIDSLESARKAKPDDAKVLRNLGRAYMARERWADAASVLEKARAVDGANQDGVKLLGIALERSGRHTDAIALLKAAAAKKPNDVELLAELGAAQIAAHDSGANATLDRAKKAAGTGREGARMHNQIALLLREQGRTKEALAEFRAAVKQDPTWGPALGNLGMALVEAGEWANAKGTLEAAAARDPDPQLRYFLGQAKLETGDTKGAIADLEEARSWGYDPKAIAAMLARCYEAEGDDAKANDERSKAGSVGGMQAAEEDARKGYELLQKRDYAGAAEKLRKAVKEKPDDGASQFNLGLALLQMGNAADAIAPLRDAASRMIDQDVVWYALATAYENSGDKPHAAGAWMEMLQRFPDRADVSAHLGHLLVELGQYAQAVDRLETAAKSLPNDPTIRYDLAVAEVAQHHPADAIAPLQSYLAARPDDLEARDALAQALLDTGMAPAAAAEFERLATKQPKVARHALNAAIAYRAMKDAAKEKKWLLSASQLAPDDAAVWNDLGRLQFQDKEWAAAEASFRRAAALDPKNQAAAQNAATAKSNADLEAMKSSRLHLGVIVVKEKAQADVAMKRLAKGESFANVATALSTHESASNGGDLGWVDPSSLPDWAQVAKTLKPGERSAVAPLKGGFAIFLRYPD